MLLENKPGCVISSNKSSAGFRRKLRMKLEDSNEAVTLDFEQDVDRSVISPRVQEKN